MISDKDDVRVIAYRNGLYAAGFLNRFFPDRFEQIAHEPVTLPMLVRVTEYFLSLAHQHLFAMDEGWAEINLSADPAKALVVDPKLTDKDAASMLYEELGNLLLHPFPCFWGLPREWESVFSSYGSPNFNIVLPAIWRIVDTTKWAFNEVEFEDGSFLEEAFKPDAWAIVVSLPQLPPNTNMDRLCTYLDIQTIQLDPEAKPIDRLGSIIRYILRMTGNSYADCDANMIMEDYGGSIGFDFTSSVEELSANREAQREGEACFRLYDTLETLTHTNPDLLEPLAAAILAAAAHLEANPEPDTLVEILGQAEDAPAAAEQAVTHRSEEQTPKARRERPWIKRSIQPQRTQQENILMAGARPDAQISVFSDGTTLLTRRNGKHGYACYPVSQKVLSQTLSQVPMTSGSLLPNTLGAGWIQGRPWWCLYVPSHTRTLQTLVREVERAYTFVLPPLIWWGWTNQFRIWALNQVPADGTFPGMDTPLYVAPFPNCQAGGNICWGTARAPGLKTAADLLPSLDLFLGGTYFNDHMAGNKSQSFEVNVLRTWDAIEPGAVYPLDDLVAANIGSKDRPSYLHLSTIINAQWRMS